MCIRDRTCAFADMLHFPQGSVDYADCPKHVPRSEVTYSMCTADSLPPFTGMPESFRECASRYCAPETGNTKRRCVAMCGHEHQEPGYDNLKACLYGHGVDKNVEPRDILRLLERDRCYRIHGRG